MLSSPSSLYPFCTLVFPWVEASTKPDTPSNTELTRTLMTNAPFSVNLTLLPATAPPDCGVYARVIIEENVRIVELRAAGTRYHPFTNAPRSATPPVHLQPRHRLPLSIDGFECAGHVGAKQT